MLGEYPAKDLSCEKLIGKLKGLILHPNKKGLLLLDLYTPISMDVRLSRNRRKTVIPNRVFEGGIPCEMAQEAYQGIPRLGFLVGDFSE